MCRMNGIPRCLDHILELCAIYGAARLAKLCALGMRQSVITIRATISFLFSFDSEFPSGDIKQRLLLVALVRLPS